MQADGERLPLAVKDLGSCDMYPGTLVHSPNGRFVAVCGDGEYIIYTALAWRNKSYGAALSFVWGEDSNLFATRDSSSSVRWGSGALYLPPLQNERQLCQGAPSASRCDMWQQQLHQMVRPAAHAACQSRQQDSYHRAPQTQSALLCWLWRMC